jgi:hypothetical protein
MVFKSMKTIRTIIASFCLVCLCSCTTQKPIPLSLPAEVPFDIKLGVRPIFVKLHLEDGRELPFMLDTGSPETFLDKSLESKLGKRLETIKLPYGWKEYGAPACGVYAPPKLYLGNTRLQTGRQVFTDDLTRIWPGRPMMGILGMDCLQNYCLQLDFQAMKLRFLDPGHPQDGNLGRAFPITWFSGEVSTRIDFCGKKDARFALDTADYADGALKAGLFQLALDKQESVWTLQYKTNGISYRVAYLPKCAINGGTNTQLAFRDSSMGAVCSENILGLAFFARNLTTFNFPKRVMYLKQTSIGPFTNKTSRTNAVPAKKL